jgi:cation diffusion facilitator family transporter
MKFLYKTFIKDYQNVSDSKVREKYGILAGSIGIICNFILVITKLVVGLIVNSISLIGDSLNNFGDTLSSVINVFSFKINSKPADREHPYGHQRSEYVGGLLISILIIVVALQLLISSVEKIITPSPTKITWYVLIILLLNIIVKSFMAILYRNSGNKINSLSLKASYKDSLNDILTTLIIVIGLYTSKYLNFDLDGYLGVCLSIFIIVSGMNLIKDSIAKLLGEPLEESKEKAIVNDILANNDIIGVHDVLTHQYGEGITYMSAHVEMDASKSLMQAHDIVDLIERKIKKDYKIELLIHIDPVDFSNKELARVKSLVIKTLNSIDEKLSCHDIRITEGENKIIYFDLVMPYDYQNRSKEILNIVIGEIKRNCDYKPTIEINYK